MGYKFKTFVEGARLSDDHSMLGLSENMALMQAAHRFSTAKIKALSCAIWSGVVSFTCIHGPVDL